MSRCHLQSTMCLPSQAPPALKWFFTEPCVLPVLEGGSLGYNLPLPSTLSAGQGPTASMPGARRRPWSILATQCHGVVPILVPSPSLGRYLHTSALLLHYCTMTSYLPLRCPSPPRAYSFSRGAAVTMAAAGHHGLAVPLLPMYWDNKHLWRTHSCVLAKGLG